MTPRVNFKWLPGHLYGKAVDPRHEELVNRLRPFQVAALLLAFSITLSSTMTMTVDAAIPWATWVPTTYTSLGWSNPPGGKATGRVTNFLFSQDAGNANDTIVYAELLVDPSNNTVLAYYIDLEGATGSQYTSDPFDEQVPQEARASLDAVIATRTGERFTGRTLWELIIFTFTEVWNAQLPIPLVSTDLVKLGTHDGVLLNYGGTSGLGHVLFANLCTKAAILFDVGLNSAWVDVNTFIGSAISFVTAFIAPLVEILHAASVDQVPIIASSAMSPSGSQIQPVQGTSFLTRADFLSLASALMVAFPEPTFPYTLQWNQIAIIIVLIVSIALVIYYGAVSYAKEKKKVPESQPRDLAWYK